MSWASSWEWLMLNTVPIWYVLAAPSFHHGAATESGGGRKQGREEETRRSMFDSASFIGCLPRQKRRYSRLVVAAGSGSQDATGRQ